MVWMTVLPIGGEENAGAVLANRSRQLCSRVEIGGQSSIGQAEVAAPGQFEDGSRLGGFPLANLRATVWSGFAVSQIEDAHRGALLSKHKNRPADAEFRVVGMGGYDEVIQWLHLVDCIRGQRGAK